MLRKLLKYEFKATGRLMLPLLIALLVVPAYRRCRAEAGPSLLGRWGGGAVQAAIVLAYLLMAVGNVVTV